MEKEIVNISRIALLIKRQAKMYKRQYLNGFGAFGGVLFIIVLLSSLFSNYMDTSKYIALTFPAIFIAGCGFSTSYFDELSSSQKSSFFLLLPASRLEKLISSWLLTSVIYLVVVIAMLFSINVIASSLSVILVDKPFSIFNLFSPDVLKTYAVFMVVQPIFLLGGIAFRKQNFIKTIGMLVLVSLIIGGIAVLSFFLLFNNIFEIAQYNAISFSDHMQNSLHQGIILISEILFWGFVGPFFLYISYLKMKEREV